MEKAKALAKEAVGFLPGVGTAMDVADVAKSVATGDYVGAAVNTAATVLGIVPGVGRVAGKGLKAVTKSLRQADVEDAKRLIDDPLEKKLWQKDFGVDQKQKRIPEVQEAAEKLSEGKITSGEYRRTVKAKQPIDSIAEDNFPEFPTLKSIVGSLDKNKVEKGIVGVNKVIPDGTRVGSRLDIPAYEDYDTWVVSLHDGTVAGGKAIGYAQTAILKNVEFLSSAKGGLNIAKGKSKSTIARIHGDYYNADPEDTYALSKELLNDPEWTQVGMNPFRHSYFYNKATGQPVLEAKEVIQVGPLVLAKGIKVPTISDLKRLKVKTPDKKIRMFNKGGDTMEQQMNFAFMNEGGVLADDGVERDPVSGNEVPAGSMAEEVRDDVPAMLSEGEYVVPADVVRFHGIQKFEELRDEAKMGLTRMEADGRIGGQPVEEQEEFPFPVEELEGFNEGGSVGDTYSDVMGSDFKAGQPYGASEAGRFPGVGFELRNFTNPKTGKTVVIPFFNGMSMQYIPPDFLQGGSTTTQGGTADPVADERDRQEDEAERARINPSTGMSDLAFDVARRAVTGETSQQAPKSFSEFSTDEWMSYVKNADSKLADVTSKIPVIGFLQRLNENAARSFADKALRTGVNPATNKELNTEERLTLQRVMMLAPNTSITEAIVNSITGKRGMTKGVPLTEQKGYKKDLLPDLSNFKQAKQAPQEGPFYKAGETDGSVTEKDLPLPPTGDFFGESSVDGLGSLGSRPEDSSMPTQSQKPGIFRGLGAEYDKAVSDLDTSKKSPATNAFDMSASAQVASANVKEGLYYNPGNIEIGQNYAGEIGTYADGRFAQFSTPQFGIRALTVDMRTKAERYNNDVESMLLEYLGGGREGSIPSRYKKAELENPNARTYINNAVNAVGNKKIDTSNVEEMKSLVSQIITNENTKEIADFYLKQPNVIEEGIVLSQKSFPKETKLADARKDMSGELFQAGLIKQPPVRPSDIAETAVAQTPIAIQPAPIYDKPQTLGVPYTPPAINTNTMLSQAAKGIPAGSDIGGATPEYYGPTGFQNIITPQTTPQSTLPFVQGPSVAPSIGQPPVSPATARDSQMQDAFRIPKQDRFTAPSAPRISAPSATSAKLPTVSQPYIRPAYDAEAARRSQTGMDDNTVLQQMEEAIKEQEKLNKVRAESKAKAEASLQKEAEEAKKPLKRVQGKEEKQARQKADNARDEVLRQGGSVQEAFDAAQTAFTGFTPSGEMVDPNISDPFSDIPSFGAFNEGGLASRPKKSKPKKRNTKKGLGGKMAT